MDTRTIGLLSGLCVIISIIPYIIRTWQGKIRPNPVSWLTWSLIGFALLVTYRSSGAEDNIWPAVSGFINPTLISLLLLYKGVARKKLEWYEKTALVICLVSLGLWAYVRKSESLSSFALYLTMFADSWATLPTIVSVWKEPDSDRPFAWAIFGVGYGITIFAIQEHTFANYALPIFMITAAILITTPLALYRMREKIRLGEWI